MSLKTIPESWLDTLENDEDVIAWRSSVDFPNSLTEMLFFIHRHSPRSLERMVGSPEGMPQSFAHWWCYMRVARQEQLPAPVYKTIEHWKKYIGKYHAKILIGAPTDVSVITVFITWLDQLTSDQILFQDENVRWFVPRKYGDLILCNYKGGSPASRRDTAEFIKAQGHLIFKERGFKEGEQYWTEMCKKYSY